MGEEFEFDPSFVHGGKDVADLQQFSRENIVVPGVYRVDLELNGSVVARENVTFITRPGRESAQPCLTLSVLDRLGVDVSKLSAADRQNQEACIELPTLVAAASVFFDSNEQRLILSVPQVNLRRTVQGYVDPSQWDSGVTAGMLNYDYNSFYSSTLNGGNQQYLGLQSGLNLGGWRLRSNASLDWNNGKRAWQVRSLYAQTEVRSLSSQLTLGDTYTSGNLFDSFNLRGVQLGSDERMLPDSQSGYAPVVRGVANTNAKVTIRQNGYVIYETTVAPGTFEINDLYPSGYGGDLQVQVTEADGTGRYFSVPYAAVARMLRPDAQRYNFAFGQYRDGYRQGHERLVGQMTYERGLSNLFTGYAGLLGAQGYLSPMLGTAMNTSIGAFGLDVTQATTRLPEVFEVGAGRSSGHSLRLSYSKTIPSFGSTISVAAYRYSTRGFYSLQEAMGLAAIADRNEENQRRRFKNALDATLIQRLQHQSFLQAHRRQRSSMQFTLNQSLGGSGSMYLTAVSRNYWGQDASTTDYQVGYRNSTRYFSYAFAVMRSDNDYGNSDQLSASISIPLGDRVSASSSVNFTRHGAQTQAGLFGTSGENNQYAWSAGAANDEQHAKSGFLSGGYSGSSGMLNASASSGAGYRQASWGASGSVVAHPGGVSFGQRVGDTFAIVEAPGAAGASVTSQSGVKVDARGYAVLPYLTPYRGNNVDLDPVGISTDVELASTSELLVPSAGAVLMAKFATIRGRASIIDLELPQGLIIPFGTPVIDEKGGGNGVVGQGGRVLARGLEGSGTLLIRWGERESQQCRVTYVLPTPEAGSQGADFERITAPCIQKPGEWLAKKR